METMVERPQYMQWLNRWRDHELVKVLTGVRRCGKSTVLAQFAASLRDEGVANEQILWLNLEDPDVAALASDAMTLYHWVLEHLASSGTTYVLLDEVQQVPDFQRAIDGLFIKPGVDVYITGSNAALLSGDLATLLAGRYVELAMLPLSFAEYVRAHIADQTSLLSLNVPRERLFTSYLESGSFPYTLRLEGDTQATREYLSAILNTVLIKDVMTRQEVRNPAVFLSVVDFVLQNVGSFVSPQKISDTMTSLGRPISAPTVESYLSALERAFVLYPVKRYDVRGRKLLRSVEKYYVVDAGLRRALLGSSHSDLGHMLENTVYLELLRRGGRVWVGKVGQSEVDFVVDEAETTTYVQVAATVRDEAVLERELAPLRAIPDHHPRLLLTLDNDPSTNHDGIRQVNALEWLLQPPIAI